eukprot:218040-Amorphochlora_amoeboformis.AAC.1
MTSRHVLSRYTLKAGITRYYRTINLRTISDQSPSNLREISGISRDRAATIYSPSCIYASSSYNM